MEIRYEESKFSPRESEGQESLLSGKGGKERIGRTQHTPLRIIQEKGEKNSISRSPREAESIGGEKKEDFDSGLHFLDLREKREKHAHSLPIQSKKELGKGGFPSNKGRGGKRVLSVCSEEGKSS